MIEKECDCKMLFPASVWRPTLILPYGTIANRMMIADITISIIIIIIMIHLVMPARMLNS